MNCLVIGGTGYLGRLLVAELLKKEHSVAVLHRRPKHDLGRRVANIVADRNDAHAVKAALAPDDAAELYVRNKAMSERALFRLHQRIGLPAVTLRPPYVYGPGRGN